METVPVAEAFLLWGGHALVFDELGRPVPELQGPRTPELVARIRAASTSSTRWYGWGVTGPLAFDEPAGAAVSRG